MSAALRGMTAGEFLAWEERQEVRHEYDGLRPVAMTGAREAHEDIVSNIIIAVGSRLRGTDSRVYAGNMKVLADRSYRYPDALIVCGPRDPRRTIAENPVVVFEVLSESTGAADRVIKRAEYGRTPGIRRYVMLEQTLIGAEVITRAGDDWVGRSQGAGSVLALPEAGIELPLDELYNGLDMAALAAEPHDG